MWEEELLELIAGADEWTVRTEGANGELASAVTIWGVRVGDSGYVRSAYGRSNGWYLRALRTGRGTLQVPGHAPVVVQFEHVEGAIEFELDAAYHAKYDHHGWPLDGDVTGVEIRGRALRVMPANRQAHPAPVRPKGTSDD